MAVKESLSSDEARRAQLYAQGLPRRVGRRAAGAAAGAGGVLGVVDRIGMLQIDSVNVLARAHLVPPYSRLGAYPDGAIDALAFRDRSLFEYSGHAACYLPLDLWPLSQWRMAANEIALDAERTAYVETVFAEVEARGGLAASELSDPRKRPGKWWSWGAGKSALEYLFRIGRLTVGDRRNFERVYDVPSRVLPASVLSLPAVAEADARRELVLRAARALGVATVGDLATYWYMKLGQVRAAVRSLVEDGALVPVVVDGWDDVPAFVVPDVKVPRAGSVAGRALVSPFDPLLFERGRVARVFGFSYKIEIYVPAAKREYGYYVLPFLLDDLLVARVDLKADRRAGVLLVQGAWGELASPVPRARVVEELSAELSSCAAWLGLSSVVVVGGGPGDLMGALRKTKR